MARIGKKKRRRTGAKRLDLSDLRHVLKDRRCWVCMGVVTKPDGEASHYELITEDGAMDVLVDVVTQPEEMDLTCRLAGKDVWRIPNEGDEVVIVMPAGELAFMPIIVATLSTGDVPDGAAPGVTVIANTEVLIHDGAGGAEELVKKSAYEAHVHPTGTGPSGVANNASAPTSYTEILKGK